MSRVLTVRGRGRWSDPLYSTPWADAVFLRRGWLADGGSPVLSCSLPKRLEPYRRRACRPFFEGLLPEGTQREVVARVLGVSPSNEFRLLERLGGDVAGCPYSVAGG